MKCKRLVQRLGFQVGITARGAQAALMILAPHGKEGGRDNAHRGADQWLYVMQGTGLARVNRRRIPLSAGTLLLIQQGDRHEIRNTGRKSLKTINFYTPPAYRPDGTPRAQGRP